MKLVNDNVPTTFVRLDESVVAADRFVDVRTQQQLRTNHNALCGGGHMRTLFADEIAPRDSSTIPGILVASDYESFPAQSWTGVNADPRLMTTVVSTDVRVSQLCRKVKLRMKVASSTNTYQINLYAGLFGRTEENRALASVAIGSSSLAWHTLDLTVPTMQRSDGIRQLLTFRLFFTPATLGADRLSPAIAISAASTTSVDVATASLGTVAIGDLAYCIGGGSYPTLFGRPIQHIERLDGTTSRVHIFEGTPWHPMNPYPGSHTFQARACTRLKVKSVQLYEYCRSGTFSTLESEI